MLSSLGVPRRSSSENVGFVTMKLYDVGYKTNFTHY
jgi:hypothetical protein